MDTVYFFANGNTGYCTENEQVPELQVPWLLQYVQFLESKGVNPLEVEFNLPNGLIAQVFKAEDGNYSWKFL